MNLSQFQYIKAVAETGSFSKAAEKCFVTQPSLSNAIRQFEVEIGGQIFIRTTRKVDFTPFGKQLLPYIEAVLEARKELEKSAKSYLNPSHKLIRIGLSPLVNIHLLTTVLEPFQRSHSEVEIVYKECFLDDLEQRLDYHKLDIAFAPEGFIGQKHHRHFIYGEPLHYLSKNSRGAFGPVLLKEIASEVFAVAPNGCGLSNSIRRLFAENGLQFQEYAGQALSHQVLEDWADLGVAATILPNSKIVSKQNHSRLILVEENRPANIKFEMLWDKDAARPEHIKSFIQYMKTKVPALLGGLANHNGDRGLAGGRVYER